LDAILMLAYVQLARILTDAWSNPSELLVIYLWISLTWNLIVILDIDIVHYNKALNKSEMGKSENWKAKPLKMFPSGANFIVTLDKLVVLLDSEGRYICWYLPGAISSTLKVRFITISRSDPHDDRMICCMLLLAWQTIYWSWQLG